jgi:flagellar hook-associated protein 1 FlgK
MSISSLLNIGSRAMAASYAQLTVTGNNIANANTPGYSQQTANLETSFSQQTPSGFFGSGVDVASVTRAHSDFLTREAAVSASIAAADDTRSTQLQQLQGVFPTDTAGLGYAAQQAFNSFVDVANNPQDSSARQAALSSIGDMASDFSNASSQIDAQQAGVADQLRTSVASVNSLTSQIAALNTQIAAAQAGGQSPNSLLDQRDTAINSLSQLVGVTTVAAADGTVGVFLGGSQTLVLGSNATALATVPDAYDPSKVQIGITTGNTTQALPDGFIASGSVSGLLRVQNHDIPNARALLGQLAASIAGAMNSQQALGLDLGTPASAGGPVLSIGAPQVLPSSNNATSGGVPVASYVNGSGTRVSSVSITVVDSSALQPSDYQLTANPSLPAGQYTLTRLSDGSSQTVSSGDVVDGFRIDVASPAPAAGDKFLLQPDSTAASGMALALTDPSGIAAAAPVQATANVANTGTATVGSLSVVDPSVNPNLTATVTFTDNSGDYSYSLVDTTGALPTVNGTGTLAAGSSIALNGWQLSLTGTAKTGDSFVVAKTAYPAADNGNANAMLALGTAAIVGQGGSVAAGQNVTDAYASALANIGVSVQSAMAAATQSDAISSAATTAASNQSGVNLDEEAARLIQYQQSYQAAAKMLQVAQTVFDSLLLAVGSS